MTLITAHTSPYSFDKDDVWEDLVPLFDFEDTAELLLSDTYIACDFLTGTWRGSGRYFSIDDDYRSTCDLPWIYYSGTYPTYAIKEGTYFLENKSGEKKPEFTFSLITPDSMEVYCHKNGYTYILYRQ